MPSRGWTKAAFLAAAVFGAAAAPARGQTVQGQLLDEATGAPVEGALAMLLDVDGVQVAGYLTNDAGRFLLRAPGPGRYTVRAERIGYRTVESAPFQLSSSQIEGIRLQTGQSAVVLEEIRVEGEQQCVVRPEEGLLISEVWDEARKALTVQEWAEGERAFRFTLVNYERTLDPTTLRILEQTRRVREGVAESPIRSLPAEELLRDGFIQEEADGGYSYYGPDASVLLSDRFLDTHCLRLRRDEDQPDLVGLDFEPAHPHEIPDIHGTLWLNQETSELEYLEYRYTWSPWEEAINVAGGRVEFEEMPNGAWIIRRWRIRMPVMAQEGGGIIRRPARIRVASLKEVGGEITRSAYLNREVISEAGSGFVTGRVWDSTRYAPLAGAEVYLSGTEHAATTDSVGEFVMDRVSEGLFTASFTHPRLDSLPFTPLGVDVRVTPGEVSELHLAIPRMDAILALACPVDTTSEEERGEGVVVGTVRAADTGRPLSGATVLLQWSRYTNTTGRGVFRGDQSTLELTTGPGGRFTACGLPVNHLIISQAQYLDRRSDTLHIRAQEGTLTPMELTIRGGGES